MNENKRKKIIYLALVLAVIWGAYSLKGKSGKEVAVQAPETVTPLTATVTAPSVRKLINIEQKTQTAWGGDPFQLRRSVTTVSKRVLSWHLSGIVYNSQAALAIINGRPVKVGDKIDDAKVVKIEAKKVTLEHNGKGLTLTMAKG